VLAILVMLAFRPQRNSTGTRCAPQPHDAIAAYEHGGRSRRMTIWKTCSAPSRAGYVFDELGNEISGRSSQGWAEHVAAGKPLHRAREWFFRVRRSDRIEASSDGPIFTPLRWSCRRTARLFRTVGIPIPGLIIAVISTGVVCYFLAGI